MLMYSLVSRLYAPLVAIAEWGEGVCERDRVEEEEKTVGELAVEN